jgi:hypothetical protein
MPTRCPSSPLVSNFNTYYSYCAFSVNSVNSVNSIKHNVSSRRCYSPKGTSPSSNNCKGKVMLEPFSSIKSTANTSRDSAIE